MEIKEVESEEIVRVIPPWKEQITIRAIVVSILIGIINSVVVMKLNLTTGFVPNLDVSVALLTFLFIGTWTKLLRMANFVTTPFTRQENTIIQTCAVACYSIAVGGGLGSYLLGMSKRVDTEGNSPGSYVEPRLDWMIVFFFLVSIVGLSFLAPYGESMIISFELPFASGSATADLINGYHTAKGDKMAKKQVQGFMKFFSVSFLWSFFQWFYSGAVGKQCGFHNFPILGLRAWKQTFYFDFSMTYVGAGMLCSHLINFSLLFGAVLSWGVMWPLISVLSWGVMWPLISLQESSINGYKVFISIALILGDGLYNFLKTMFITFRYLGFPFVRKDCITVSYDQNRSLEDIRRDKLFVKDNIPFWRGFWGYIFFSVVCCFAVDKMFPQLKKGHIDISIVYLVAGSISMFTAIGSGLTNKNMAENHGRLALFIIAAFAGKENGIVPALILCGFVKTIISTSSDLMHNFKTGHLTLTSPKSILISQGIGIAIGCVVGPVSFLLFYKAYDVGNPIGDYKAPQALIYRSMAVLGAEGLSALPHGCLQLCVGFFAFAVLANLLRDVLPEEVGKWVPLPTAVAVPFIVGAYFAVDMCIGSLVVFVWSKMDRRKASVMIPAVASGLICGDGLWAIPSAVLALAKISPPMCMSFIRS